MLHDLFTIEVNGKTSAGWIILSTTVGSEVVYIKSSFIYEDITETFQTEEKVIPTWTNAALTRSFMPANLKETQRTVGPRAAGIVRYPQVSTVDVLYALSVNIKEKMCMI